MFRDISKFSKEIKALPRLFEPKVLDSVSSKRIKENLLKMVAEQKPETFPEYVQPTYAYSSAPRNTFLRYAMAVFVGLSLLGGTAYASNSTIPGQTLYPIKIWKEKFQLTFTFGEEEHAMLEAKFAQERLDELAKLYHLENNTNSIFATSTAPSEQTKQKAKNEAGRQVRHAIEVLGGVKQKLQAKEKVNTKAVEAIEKNIQKLEQNALAQNVDLKDPKGNANGLIKQEIKQDGGPVGPVENGGKGNMNINNSGNNGSTPKPTK